MEAATLARKRTGEVKPTLKIVVIDDHPIVRLGLVRLLATDESLEVCGETDNAATAVEMVVALKPDLVMMDLSLPGAIGGLELLSQLMAAAEGVKVLVVSMLDEAMYAENALQRGAAGFVEKNQATDQLLVAVHEVLAGRLFVPPATRDRLLGSASRPHRDGITDPVMKLSPRETQVFQLIGQGLSTDQAAIELELSPKTVHTHRQHIMDKLGLLTSSQLVVHAASWVKHRSLNGSHAHAASEAANDASAA